MLKMKANFNFLGVVQLMANEHVVVLDSAKVSIF